MNYWLVTDTHFNHSKLETWGGRSGDWQGEILLGLAEIPEGDTLIHLGDICIGNDAEIHRWLEGLVNIKQKILVRGNHDKKSASWYLEHGWDFVCDGLHLEFMGETLLLTHRPMHPDMWRFTRNIHGHTHGNNHHAEEYHEWYTPDFHVDISPEIVGYRPISLKTLLKNYAKKNNSTNQCSD